MLVPEPRRDEQRDDPGHDGIKERGRTCRPDRRRYECAEVHGGVEQDDHDQAALRLIEEPGEQDRQADRPDDEGGDAEHGPVAAAVSSCPVPETK